MRLRQKIWIRDLQYLHKHSAEQIVVGTSYHQLRLYDTKAQRRPLFNAEIGEDPITCVMPVLDGTYVLVHNQSLTHSLTHSLTC
jgi:ribosome biogenesis protein NSA1